MWQFATGGEIWSTPVLYGGSILVGSNDGKVYSVDRASGQENWAFTTAGEVRSRLAICEGKVLFSSDDGYLYTLDAAGGGEEWRFSLDGGEISRRLPDPFPPYEYDYLTSSPVCSGGTVYIGSANGYVYAVESATGKEKWKFKTGGKIRSTPLVHGGLAYIGSWDQHVYALDAGSGEEVWRFDTGGIVQASPAHGDGKIFIGSRNPKIFALDAMTGKPVWEHVHEDGSWVESSAVYADGRVYIGSSDARALQALDPDNGQELWRYETGGWSWCTPLVAEHTVYIGAIGASPYWVALQPGMHAVDRSSGTRRWSLDVGLLSGGFLTGGVHGSPILAEGVLYLAALDGNLYALEYAPTEVPRE